MKRLARCSPPSPSPSLLVLAGVQSAGRAGGHRPHRHAVTNKSATGPLGPLPSLAGRHDRRSWACSCLARHHPVHAVRAPVHPGRGDDEGRSRRPGARSGRSSRVAPSISRRRPRSSWRRPPCRRPLPAAAAPQPPPARDGRPAAGSPAAAAPAPAPAARRSGRRRRACRRPRRRGRPAPQLRPLPAPGAPGAARGLARPGDLRATLEELLAKGTDRRVAEGQARRAAMIAARKKAAGG